MFNSFQEMALHGGSFRIYIRTGSTKEQSGKKAKEGDGSSFEFELRLFDSYLHYFSHMKVRPLALLNSLSSYKDEMNEYV